MGYTNGIINCSPNILQYFTSDKKVFFLLIFKIILFLFVSVSFAGQQLDIGMKDLNKDNSGHFVKIEYINENTWAIKAITKTPIRRDNSKQDILYLDLTKLQIQPYYYEGYATVSFDKTSFDCCWPSEKQREYSPCKSLLTKTPLNIASVLSTALSLGAGMRCVRSLDEKKIQQICDQTDMIVKIKECDDIAMFLDKIIIEPRIIDESGLHSSSNFIKITKRLDKHIGCPVDLNQVRFDINLSSTNGKLVTVFEPQSYYLPFNTNGYSLQPTVRILSKKYSDLYPNALFEDKNLKIILNRIDSWRSNRIEFYLNVQNKTDNYLSLEMISFYINQSILTPLMSSTTLPPKSFDENIKLVVGRHINDKNQNVFDDAKNSIQTDMTRGNIANKNITIGISVKYKVNEINQVMFKLNKYKFINLIEVDN